MRWGTEGEMGRGCTPILHMLEHFLKYLTLIMLIFKSVTIHNLTVRRVEGRQKMTFTPHYTNHHLHPV